MCFPKSLRMARSNCNSKGEYAARESCPRTIADIEQFAALSGDNFYAHMSETDAARNPLFGGRVAHGYFLISAAAGFLSRAHHGQHSRGTRFDRKLAMPIDVARYSRDFASLQFLAPEAGILELVMAIQGRLNAATEAMHRDLSHVWRAIDTDDAVRVVMVRGEGANFSAGGDFDMIDRMIDDEATLIRVWKEASDLVYNLINCSKPVVSAIRGSAVGAGLAIALLADVSVAAENARILDGHTRLGVAAGDHAVIIWPLLCGLARARDHLLTNKSLSGAEAERIGLVAVAVPDAQVLDTAFEVARTLAAGSATAMRWTKHALNNWLRLAGPSFDTSLALEFLGFKLADVCEGLTAAREKRRPTSIATNRSDRLAQDMPP
jgi:enoyl-CoA hydratase